MSEGLVEARRRQVEDKRSRIGQERVADGGNRILDAGEKVAVVRLPRAQLREKRKHPLERPRAAAAVAFSTSGGGDEVLAHGEIGKHLATLRHETESRLRDAIRGQAMQRFAFEEHLTALWHADAHDRLHGGRLAHAVPAKQAHHLPAAHFQVDAEQHLAAAVRGLELAQLEHQDSSPRYAARTSALARIASGAPVAMTRP